MGIEYLQKMRSEHDNLIKRKEEEIAKIKTDLEKISDQISVAARSGDETKLDELIMEQYKNEKKLEAIQKAYNTIVNQSFITAKETADFANKITEEHNKKIKKVNDDLLKQIKALFEAYKSGVVLRNAAITERADIVNFSGMKYEDQRTMIKDTAELIQLGEDFFRNIKIPDNQTFEEWDAAAIAQCVVIRF